MFSIVLGADIAVATYMRIIPHNSKLSPYPSQPVGVIRIVLPLVGWTEEPLGGEVFPIAQLDEHTNLTKCALSHSSVAVLDRPLAGGLDLAWCCSGEFAVQAKRADGQNCLLALLEKCLQVPDVLRIGFSVVGKLDFNDKAP